ncbi:hypothetical protein [Kribbella sp. NPDC050470]|uniref:hypothetical protein n=1 Tax=unclassified Kribbella TaxID=2644121 RepID=UPI0037B74384
MHDILTDIARQAVTLWRVDLVVEMCDEPTFTAEGDDEDFRIYWFASLTKIKRSQVGCAKRHRLARAAHIGGHSDARSAMLGRPIPHMFSDAG